MPSSPGSPAPATTPPPARTTPLAADAVTVIGLIGAFLLVALAARSSRSVHVHERPPDTRVPTRPVSTAPTYAPPKPTVAPPHGGSTPVWLQIVVILALLAVVVPLIVWLGRRARRLLRHWPTHPPAEAPLGELAAEDLQVDRALARAVDDSLARLAHGPVREAIVACWIELEASCLRAGVPLLPSETPSELATRLLGLRRVDPAALDGLAELYREARFSTHRLGEPARTLARDHLRTLREDLLAASATGQRDA